MSLVMVWADAAARHRYGHLPIVLIYLVSFPAMFALPVYLVMRRRSRQEKTLSRIRGPAVRPLLDLKRVYTYRLIVRLCFPGAFLWLPKIPPQRRGYRGGCLRITHAVRGRALPACHRLQPRQTGESIGANIGAGKLLTK